MHIILLLPFLAVHSLYALTPEMCKVAQQPATQATTASKSAVKKKQIDFKSKKNLQKTINSHRQTIYKHLIKNGISKQAAKHALKLTFLGKPISSAKSQPEVLMTIDLYTSKFFKHELVAKTFLMKHSEELIKAETQYGVDKEIITALITMESLAGLRKGNINILNSLFTLSYASPRSKFFTAELVAAFKLMQSSNYHFTAQTKGSWAGAMGYSQFMPSSVLHYAKDGDNDGKIDIINSPTDAIHSAANYLKNAGWKLGEPVTKELFAEDIAKIDLCNTINKPHDGGKLIMPESKPKERFFIAYNNYNSIIRWNRSFLFAYTAGNIANGLKKN